METRLGRKLHKLLTTKFSGAEVRIEEPSKRNVGGKFIGFVSWSGFESMDHLDRQHVIWAILQSHLTEKERLNVAIIFGETPAESSSLQSA